MLVQEQYEIPKQLWLNLRTSLSTEADGLNSAMLEAGVVNGDCVMQLGVILTALAVLLGAVASGASTTIGWVRVMYALAALLSLLALFFQWQASKPFVFRFGHSTWVPDNTGSKSIVIPARQHRKGRNATGRLEGMDPNGNWQTVIGDATTRDNGDVVASINADAQLEGRIVVY